MAWQSTVPAAMNALVSFWSADAALQGIVRDGPGPENEAALEALYVGYNGTDEDGAVDGETSREGLAANPDRERYSVHCAVSVLNGAGDISVARNRVYELFAAAGAVVTANRTLDGVALVAGIGGWQLAQMQSRELGAVATIRFNVDIDAYTVR